MKLIPGKLYRLKERIGFDIIDGANGFWVDKNELVLLLDRTEIPSWERGQVYIFLYDSKKIWRAVEHSDSFYFQEEPCWK